MPKTFAPKSKTATPAVKTTTKPQSSQSSKSGTKPGTKPNSSTPKTATKPSPKPVTQAKPKPTSTPKAAPKKTVVESSYPIPDYSGGIEIAEGTKPTFDPGGAIATPLGTAMWAWIGTKADEAFNKEPQQKITVVFDPDDSELEDFYNRLKAFQDAWYEANGEDPSDSIAIFKDPDDTFVNKFREAVGDENAEPGPRIEFKRKAKFNDDGDAIPVPVFNAEGEQDDSLHVWNGDRVCVEFSLGGYISPSKSIGIGMKPYLRSVQLVAEGPRVGAGTGGTTGGSFRKRGTAKPKATKVVAEEEVEESSDELPFDEE